MPNTYIRHSFKLENMQAIVKSNVETDHKNSGFSDGTDSFSTALLSDRFWVGLLIVTLCLVVMGRAIRYFEGVKASPIAIVLQIYIYIVVFASLYLRKTKYADLTKTIYITMLHIQVPFSLLIFGGAQGFGDIAFFTSVALTALFGWRRWMIATYFFNILALLYVLYSEAIGQPVAPFVANAPLFNAIKFLTFLIIMVLILNYASRFYRRLLVRYRQFGNEQLRLNHELQINEVALQNVMIDLRKSRLKIVTAREEERRRIRRDLHDGLGPTLAAQIFRVGATRQLIFNNPTQADHLLAELENGIEETLADVRNLVYDLRPPSLDQLGLIGAIRDFLHRYDTSFSIDLNLPTALPPISAAVEVAAFRIVQTALDNVAQHANSKHCNIILKIMNELMTIEIVDDGIGIANNHPVGIGLTSIGERADELGGTFIIKPKQSQGTHLFITLPIGISL